MRIAENTRTTTGRSGRNVLGDTPGSGQFVTVTMSGSGDVPLAQYFAELNTFSDGSQHVVGHARHHNRGTVLLLSCCDNERTVPVYVPKS